MPSVAARRRTAGRSSAPRIYCAGPLFAPAERTEMAAIAGTLEQAGFAVFLPQRDGLVFADALRELVRGGYTREEAAPLVQRAIFWLECHEVLVDCRGLVLNGNGRVPDEGAVAAAAMAWTAGLPVVLYKDDDRGLLQGLDHPLVAGLAGFVRVTSLPEIAYAFTKLLARRAPVPALPRALRAGLRQGKKLAQLLAGDRSATDLPAAIVSLVREAGQH